VTFRLVTLEEAFAAARTARDRIAGLPALLQPFQPELTSERLLRLNLIDGVVKAQGPLGQVMYGRLRLEASSAMRPAKKRNSTS
jgi:hypothetical protein